MQPTVSNVDLHLKYIGISGAHYLKRLFMGDSVDSRRGWELTYVVLFLFRGQDENKRTVADYDDLPSFSLERPANYCS